MEQIIGFIQTVYAFIATNLGLKADVADASGTAHGKLKYIIDTSVPDVILTIDLNRLFCVVSDNLKGSSDAVKTTTATTLAELKKFINPVNGPIRISFQMKSSIGTKTSTGQIYVNGVAVGTSRATTSTSYVTYTEDLVLKYGDFIQIYGKSDGGTCSVQQFRLYYDLADSYPVVVLD